MNHKTLVAFLLAFLMLLPVLVIIPDGVAAESGSTVGTSTNVTPHWYNSLHKGPYYANGWFYELYYDGANYVYQSSSDLLTWNAKQTAVASMTAPNIGIWSDGAYLHVAYILSNSVIYLRGTANSDGSITWGTPRTAVDGSTNACASPSITVTSDSHVVIGYRQTVSSSTCPYVILNGDTTASDAWTTATGFPAKLSTTSSSSWIVNVLPSSDGGVFSLYHPTNSVIYHKTCSGSGTLGAQESASLVSVNGANDWSATVSNGILHLVYIQGSNDNVVFRDRSATGTWDVSATTLQASNTQSTVISITADPNTNDLWIFWNNYPSSNHVYYIARSGGAWGSVTDWLDESVDGGLGSYDVTSPATVQNNQILVAYKTKSASPYNIKVAVISLLPPGPVANFTASPLSGYTDLEVTFTDSSTNNPTGWNWTFGDGSYSTEQNPTHIYRVGGSFNVTLTASNVGGSDSMTRSYYINVTLTLAIVSTPSLNIEPGSVYTYQLASNYDGVNYTVWCDSGELALGPNGTFISGRISDLGNVNVTITAVGLDGQTAYQNYTLVCQYGEGYVTDEIALTVLLAVAFLAIMSAVSFMEPRLKPISGMTWVGCGLFVFYDYGPIFLFISTGVGLYFLIAGVYGYIE